MPETNEGVAVRRSIPAGYVGAEKQPARQALRRPALKGDHRPLGVQYRRTADSDDAMLGWYPTRSNPAKVDSAGNVVLGQDGKPAHELSPEQALRAGVFSDPGQAEITPVRFHPNELPDPEAAFDARLYPQAIPAHQIDPRNQTHSLSGHIAADDPIRHRS